MNKRLTIKREVTVNLTGREWQIFSPEYGDDLTQEGYDECVAALNKAAGKALSKQSPLEAEKYFHEVLWKWDKYGAGDTEPRGVFRELMDEVYGEDLLHPERWTS